MSSILKTCAQCKKSKSLDEFYKRSASPDGLQPICKVCNRKNCKDYRERNKKRLLKEAKERRAQYVQKWSRTTAEEWERIESTESKVCSICGEDKKLGSFPRNIHNANGHDSRCKRCKALARRKEYRENKEKNREIVRRCRNKQKSKYRKTRARRIKEFPNIHRAHGAVYQAVLRGDLPPVDTQQCIQCGQQAENYHHHKGYKEEHWLSVVPVCVYCHAKERRKY